MRLEHPVELASLYPNNLGACMNSQIMSALFAFFAANTNMRLLEFMEPGAYADSPKFSAPANEGCISEKQVGI